MENLLEKSVRGQHILKILEMATQGMREPMIAEIVRVFGRDPYIILCACLLSLRSRDTQTQPVCLKLFAEVKTPQDMLDYPINELETMIRSVGFYKTKTKTLKAVSRDLLQRFSGKVPCSQEELLSLPGVGRKTANLVLGEAWGVPALCVDTHVHRLSNRLGLVKAQTPQETENALKEIFPPEDWIRINYFFVMWGQNICVPISPFCSRCALFPLCPQIGVKKAR